MSTVFLFNDCFNQGGPWVEGVYDQVTRTVFSDYLFLVTVLSRPLLYSCITDPHTNFYWSTHQLLLKWEGLCDRTLQFRLRRIPKLMSVLFLRSKEREHNFLPCGTVPLSSIGSVFNINNLLSKRRKYHETNPIIVPLILTFTFAYCPIHIL